MNQKRDVYNIADNLLFGDTFITVDFFPNLQDFGFRSYCKPVFDLDLLVFDSVQVSYNDFLHTYKRAVSLFCEGVFLWWN